MAQHHDRAQPLDDCCNDPDDPALMSEIALSLSGGGLRATGFHLGVLDCLDHLGLLQNVHILSSVSGGSMVGTSYALCQQEGKGIQACFDNLYEFFTGLNTLEQILSCMTDERSRCPSGRRDLITGMANVLQEQYFSKYYRNDTFGQLWDESPSHLKEIMFNATEFKTGTAFRFQKSQFQCRIGNGHVHIDEKHARAMRMGDVMAASACIPSGMEPLFFPEDFHWPRDDEPGRPFCTEVADRIEQQTGERSIALMDGGVYDNQGLSSILLAMLRRDRARRDAAACVEVDQGRGLEPHAVEQWGDWAQRILRREGPDHGAPGADLKHLQLFIISDTPIRSETFYPSTPRQAGAARPGFLARRTLGQYNAFAWGLTLLLLVSAGDNIHDLWRERASLGWTDIAIGLIPAAVSVTLASLMVRVRRLVGRLNTSMAAAMPAFRHSPWHYLRKLRLADVVSMLDLRVGSTVALTAKIFMNRIRQLGYSTVYSSSEDEHALSSRIMANEIYSLLDEHKADAALPPPTAAMGEIANLAAYTRTALWLDPGVDYRGHGELDILVSAGQTATCYNLLRHLRWRYGGAAGDIPAGSAADRLYQRVLALGERLREDPMCLVAARKAAGRLGGGDRPMAPQPAPPRGEDLAA
jgi:predicted acylesterase/phospholipase RssA